MTVELWCLVAAIIIGFVHIILQAHTMNMQRSLEWNAGPRDEVLPPLTGVAGRLERALKNYLETFVFFVAAVLAAQAANVHNSLIVWGAVLYVTARVIYIPLYALGVRYIRSIAWGAATTGIFLILIGLISAGLARQG